MFTATPWALYTEIVTGSLLIYYLLIGWKYFRMEIKNLFRGRDQKRGIDPDALIEEGEKTSYQSQGEKITEQDEQPEWQNEEMFVKVENLFEHLTAEIEEAHQKNYDKQDLIQMLQIILKDYQVLKRTPFQFAVNNRIDAECAKYGSIHLSEGDKGEVWRMV